MVISIKADMIWCTVYDCPCSVNEIYADEYPTICHYCMSGECESNKIYYKKLVKEW